MLSWLLTATRERRQSTSSRTTTVRFFECFNGIIQDSAEYVLRTGARGIAHSWLDRSFWGVLGGETGTCFVGVEGRVP